MNEQAARFGFKAVTPAGVAPLGFGRSTTTSPVLPPCRPTTKPAAIEVSVAFPQHFATRAHITHTWKSGLLERWISWYLSTTRAFPPPSQGRVIGSR